MLLTLCCNMRQPNNQMTRCGWQLGFFAANQLKLLGQVDALELALQEGG